MNFSILMIFQIFGIVSTWATQALADRKITLAEAVDLAVKVAEVLDVKIEIEIPTVMEDKTDYDTPGEGETNPFLSSSQGASPKPAED